ncbi:uncharacterized protein LOC112139642, partial [Oryzias melastigma]|uniref:uncharacterized protein LOC112139642 n=1 Tax=Oryzias melastigma TaxID=30732 RepID=UPI000CF7F69F
MFKGCSYQTNVYGTFKSHKSRKHSSYTVEDFKSGIVNTAESQTSACLATDEIFADESVADFDDAEATDIECKDLSDSIELNLASLLLKLENYYHVPSVAINELLSDLHYLISACEPISKKLITDTLGKHKICVDSHLIDELSNITLSNPLLKAIGKEGPLATSYKRKKYYKKIFKVIEPVEYILDSQTQRTFQYVPILKSLQQLLHQKHTLQTIVDSHKENQLKNDKQYRSFRDGLHFLNNTFLVGEELKISLCLYIDDFELCNPLGTSRKKHKLCSVYWVIGNLPPGSHSALSSIYLALLCKSEDLKTFGYQKIFEPLLQDLVVLENQGIYIEHLGAFVKGTIQYVVADNLGAHGLAGYVEGFSGEYFCRFCTASRSEIESPKTNVNDFKLRTEEAHHDHVAAATQQGVACFGVKSSCVLADSLSFFKVTEGFPPDLAHDLFEGIVPFELAECFKILIGKKYLTFDSLNQLIQSFPYKGTDQTNRPQKLPHTLLQKKTVG